MCFIYLESDSDSVRVPYAAPRRRFPSRGPFISKGKEGGRTALTPHPLAPVTNRHSGCTFSEQLSFFLGSASRLLWILGLEHLPVLVLQASHFLLLMYVLIYIFAPIYFPSPPLSFGWLFKPDFTPFEETLPNPDIPSFAEPSLGLPTIKNQESYGHRIGAIWKIWKTDENIKRRWKE